MPRLMILPNPEKESFRPAKPKAEQKINAQPMSFGGILPSVLMLTILGFGLSLLMR